MEWAAWIPWEYREAFRIPTGVAKSSIGQLRHRPLFAGCEMGRAVIAFPYGDTMGITAYYYFTHRQHQCDPMVQISKSHGMAPWPILKLVLRWRTGMVVEIIPRYIISSHNISADGMGRLSQYVCEQWKYAHGIQLVDLPELW